MPTLSSLCDFMMGLDKLQQRAKLKLLAQPLRKYYRGTPQFWGAPLAPGHPHFSSGCDFMMGLGKPKLYTKFEAAIALAVA